MTNKYTRHPRMSSVLLVDRGELESFRAKKTAEQELKTLQEEINTVKQEIAQLKTLLNQAKASE